MLCTTWYSFHRGCIQKICKSDRVLGKIFDNLLVNRPVLCTFLILKVGSKRGKEGGFWQSWVPPNLPLQSTHFWHTGNKPRILPMVIGLETAVSYYLPVSTCIIMQSWLNSCLTILGKCHVYKLNQTLHNWMVINHTYKFIFILYHSHLHLWCICNKYNKKMPTLRLQLYSS